jgi:hypothetical protein
MHLVQIICVSNLLSGVSILTCIKYILKYHITDYILLLDDSHTDYLCISLSLIILTKSACIKYSLPPISAICLTRST